MGFYFCGSISQAPAVMNHTPEKKAYLAKIGDVINNIIVNIKETGTMSIRNLSK